jgi:hypothetical protein
MGVVEWNAEKRRLMAFRFLLHNPLPKMIGSKENNPTAACPNVETK